MSVREVKPSLEFAGVLGGCRKRRCGHDAQGALPAVRIFAPTSVCATSEQRDLRQKRMSNVHPRENCVDACVRARRLACGEMRHGRAREIVGSACSRM